MNERRTAPRYELSLPVLVCISQPKPPQFHTAHLRDISTSGVYFRADYSLPVGTELELTLSLPVEITRGFKVLVRASGKVVRLDEPASGAQSFGVAAMVKRYDIIRPKSAAA